MKFPDAWPSMQFWHLTSWESKFARRITYNKMVSVCFFLGLVHVFSTCFFSLSSSVNSDFSFHWFLTPGNWKNQPKPAKTRKLGDWETHVWFPGNNWEEHFMEIMETNRNLWKPWKCWLGRYYDTSIYYIQISYLKVVYQVSQFPGFQFLETGKLAETNEN